MQSIYGDTMVEEAELIKQIMQESKQQVAKAQAKEEYTQSTAQVMSTGSSVYRLRDLGRRDWRKTRWRLGFRK